MALDKATLEQGIFELFNSLNDSSETTEDRDKRIAETLTNLIEAYIKSGTISTTITGNVDGTDVTATGTGTLS
jgi:hypothetical protein